MVGDFNDIFHNDEKIGGPKISDRSFMDFTEMLKGCDKVELTGVGDGFT